MGYLFLSMPAGFRRHFDDDDISLLVKTTNDKNANVKKRKSRGKICK